MIEIEGRFEKFAPRIRNKVTGEVSEIGLMRFGQVVTIHQASDGNSYTDSEGLIGTDNWRDIEEVEMLIPTGFYDDEGERIYVSSFDELHEMVIKNHEHIKLIHGETPYVPFFEREHEND